MSDEYVQCRLVGGIYDGDKGGVLPPLSDAIWAVACGERPEDCDQNGIHWYFDPRAVAQNGKVQRYNKGAVTPDDVQLYVHEGISPDLVGPVERERLPEPVAA